MRNRLKLLAGVLLVLVVASLAWSVIWTARNPTAAYFDLLTRYWQFGIGALIGLWVARPVMLDLPQRTTTVLSWVGVGLLLSCGLVIGQSASFPGFASLWPVAAAGLILIACRADVPGNAGRLLAVRPLSGLGEYSFGIYLWHWPVYIAVLQVTGTKPSLLLGLGIIIVSILLAVVSQRLADGAVRLTGRRIGPGRTALVSLSGLVLLVGLAVPLHQLVAHPRFAGMIDRAAWITGPFAEVTPGLLTVRHDLPFIYDAGCHQTIVSPEVSRCDFGANDPAATVFLVGGSHSAHWVPALERVAAARGWRVHSITKSACTFAAPDDEELYTIEYRHPSCAEWNEKVIDLILEERPDLVVTIASRPIFSEPDNRASSRVIGEYIPAGYVEHFRTLDPALFTGGAYVATSGA